MPIEWIEGTRFGVPPSPTYCNGVFVNSYTGAGVAADEWQIVDLKPMGIPADAIAVFLSGILIITPGSGALDPGATADLNVRFRKPGDWQHNLWGSYQGQVCDRNGGGVAPIGEGGRSTMAVISPLVNGCFEWGWARSTYHPHPSSAAYGVNMNVQMYFRP